jgi:hypothetical protein
MWLHLGTCPDDSGIWEDQVLIALPGDQGLLWMYSYHRTPPQLRPAGGSFSFQIIEPFRRGRLHFDGVGVRSPYAEMLTGRVRDGRKELFAFDIEIEAVAPVWDNHASSADKSGKDRGDMKAQVWASEHYQQLYRARGTLKLEGKTLDIDTTGVRDHSRGQRGHASNKFGGHNLWTAAFPSGNAFGMQRMWLPDGTRTLNVAFVYIDGEFHHADVLDQPAYLNALTLKDDELSLVLGSPLGEHHLRGRTLKTILASLNHPWGYSFGADPNPERGIFAPSFSRWEWNGEVSYGLTERSGIPGALK